MRKLLIYSLAVATLYLSGCSGDPIVGHLPFVYRIDVQQGNVITQEMVDKLQPGMDRTQVQFVLGTPMLKDVFHADRWDYAYSTQPGGEERSKQRVTVFFEQDRLARVEGDLRPNPNADQSLAPTSHLTTVTVPYREPPRRGLLTRMWHWIIRGGDQAPGS